MTTITPEIRQAIKQAGERPVEIADPETNSIYFLVERRSLRMCTARDDMDIRNAYPMMNQVAALEGWDDPSMDIYNA